jgi:hypothetical protein
MNYIKISIALFIIFNAGVASSQNIESHRWKNRLVLIVTNDTVNKNYNKQIEEFNKHLEGIEERKIVVYHITPEKFKSGLSDEKWQVAKTDYDKYKETDSQMEIILLGLDGGVKLREAEFLSCKKLFGTIDAMPMRIQEMRRNKNSER